MKLAWPVEIAGTGMYVPSTVLTNEDLAKRIDTSDEWITQRTGIKERRIAGEDETTLTMAAEASKVAMERAGVTPEDIDLIIVPTITPHHPLPATACELQAVLGCRQVPAFDIQAACCGFVWSAVTAAQYINSGMAKTVLVVGAETLTRITNWEDRGTCILFGDGAGAAILRKTDDPNTRILASRMGADGERGKAIWIPAGGSLEPASQKTIDENLHTMRMMGREVYKFAVTKMYETVRDTAADAGVSVDDLKVIVPHQSNARIIESAASKLGVSLDRVIVNIDKYGNTSAASAILALNEAYETGRIEKGDLVMMVAFGAGLTWGSILLRT